MTGDIILRTPRGATDRLFLESEYDYNDFVLVSNILTKAALIHE